MKQVFPEYYVNFKCAASACRHTCCAGWEIDIDGQSLERFKSVKGPFGDRLRSCISEDPEPHFVLEPGDRCPMLRGDGLCDMILQLGEESLCCICTDHPRFRNFYSDRTETGLGLCCEEVCRQIYSNPSPLELVYEGTENLDEEETALLGFREKVFEILKKNIPILDREKKILELCGGDLSERSLSEWAEFYKSLEILDERWPEILNAVIDGGGRFDTDDCMWYQNLLEYFVYRHLPSALEDGDMLSKIRFAVLSCRIIRACDVCDGNGTPEEMQEHARIYSSEIEYSQENLDTLFDELS